jgi:diadenosine tetraphosphatase ApaH/serine/threonine PP2A family protein phosphatase
VSERARNTNAAAEGTLPEGLRIYAVGDIHGRFDLLQALAAQIERDCKKAPVARAIEVYLGDYVDRGPDTRDVVEWLIETPPLGDKRICLMGNHEDLLLRALGDGSAMPNWLFNGGGQTIASYLRDGVRRADLETAGDFRAAFLDALPAKHRAFFASLPRTAVFGGYLFVHAGIQPGRALEDQDPEDLIWIREAFLDSEEDFGRIVVHGHTPVSAPDVRSNRINIDTGAVFSGRLTCVALEGKTRRFLQAVSTR